ncbi:hypothetical protein BC938DRAFT_482748 [Jimgerdemannia flammicorona]|uniref:Uncharacterized protein n=1 Tax=Jimgerdemannia flammicorona TaxID=994334 RepID=A0A433QDE8_9FUNG|nr:hypothetical protein BC938DRAFT_482748 [Jimgerdemannia flammicorona]
MDTLELSPSYIVDETGFDWDYSAIDDNIEAQKLLAAAITSNRFHSGMPDESEKRKLEELEDAVQRSPTKAMRECTSHPGADPWFD